MPHTAEAPRAGQLRGLIERGIDAGNGGDIDDGVPPHLFPDVGERDDPPEIGRFPEEEDRFVCDPQLHEDCIHDAVGSQHALYKGADDDPAQEVGQVGNRLRDALEGAPADLVQEEREHDGEDEPEDQVHQGHDHGVAESAPEFKILKEELTISIVLITLKARYKAIFDDNKFIIFSCNCSVVIL